MKTLIRFNAACVALLAAFAFQGATAKAADQPESMKYVGGAANPVINSLKEGNGWCIVSERKNVEVIKGQAAVDCVRYRMVTKYAVSTISGSNGQSDNVVELTLGAPTDWIAVACKVPTTSGPSLTVAKAANTAVAEVDALLGVLEPALQQEENATVRAEAAKVLAVLKSQRAALTDLIAKDVAAVGLVGK